MNLQEARKRIPELDGLSDDAALSVIQQVYYPDIDRSTLASRLGVKIAAPPAPERTWGQAIGDTAVQLAEGVNTTLGAIPSIVAPEGSMSGFFRDNAGYWRDKQSDVLKGRIAATDQRIQEAGKEGVMSQIGTAVSEYWNDPAQAARLVATNLPSMAATLGTGALAGAAAKGVAAARGVGAAGEAALAAQYGTRTAMATNAALNAGGARGEAYEDLKRAALAQGMSSEQAEQAALDGSIMPGVVGGVAGAVSGKLGLEKALLGQPGAGAGTALRRSAGSFGAELAGEQIEEVAPKLTTNYEAGKIDPARSLTDDLGRTMVETAIGAGPGAIVAGGVEGLSSPAQDAADTIRATEKVPESGALTKAVNAGVEAKAKAVEAGGLELAPLVDGAAPEAVTSNGLALVPRPGEQTPEPVDDPVRDQILALPDGARQDALRAYAVVNRTDVANGVQQDNRKLLDRLLAENKPEPEPAPEIGGVIRNFDPASPPVSPLSLAPMGGNVYDNGIDFQSDSQAELASRSAELDRLTQRAPRTRTDGVDLDLQADPVLNYLDNLRGVNTPAARAYVRDFDAGRITPADVQQRMQAERGLTPEQRIARAAAEAPAQTDQVAERLARAAAQGMATPAPTDILNPAGEPFKTRMAADRAAKKTPGAVVPVEGGFVVRPQEPVNVQDVPQAPEVPQAAPVVSQPDQAPQTMGAQPAGPAAGVPAEGAGAVEAAGVEPAKAPTNRTEYVAEVRRQLGDLQPGDVLENDMGDKWTVDLVMRNKAGEVTGFLPRESNPETGEREVLDLDAAGSILLPAPYLDASGNRKLSQPGKVNRAQPAGPTAGVPAEGAGAGEAAGVEGATPSATTIASTMAADGWAGETGSPDDTIWTKQVNGETYTARLIGDSMEVTVPVDGVSTQIGYTTTADPAAAAKAASKAVADGYVEEGAEAPKSTEKPAVPATTSAPIEDGGEKIGGARKAQEDGAKEREAAKSAKRRAERAKDSTETGLRVGIAPGSADPVTVRGGTVYVGKYEAVNYDTGEPVTVPKGSTGEAVAQALKDAGALSSRQRLFGLGEMGNAVMFSRSPSTKSAYEARIDALFAGEKAAGPNSGARVLDRSDVLGLLGFGDGPVNLAEGKVIKGQENHPLMTAEQWKKVPEWLDNPAAVFDSDTVPGALVLIAPETINGATVRMTVEPRKDGGADVHILTNAYDAPGFTPFARWFREGLGRLVDQKKFPAVLGDSGLQLSSSTWQNKPGMRKILTEKHLDGYRRANNPAAFMGQPTPPADSNARNVATQQLVDGLKAKWTRAPEIIVARNMQDAQIPQEVRDYDALLKSQGATGEPRGFIYQGKVYLLSNQLKGPRQIAEVLFHEVLGHYGLRGAFGDGLTPILKQLGALRRKEVVAKAREYGLFNKDALGGLDKAAASDSQIWAAMSNKQRLDAAEEVLAEMAQTQPTIGFVQRAIAAIRNWLRANVPGFKNLKLKDADIVQAYILPARAYVTRSNETAQQAIDRAMTDAGFSRTDDRINFSRTTAQSIASSMGDMTPDQEKAYKNVAGVKAVPTVRERMDALKANLGLKLRQGLVDQFAAIKQLDQNAYVQARMSKGTDGTLEAMLMYGKPFMRDGAPDVDVKDGGFAKVLASLKGEQDRWMMWIAAQRAEKLKAEGKENLMTDDDISALKTLNAGKMADGTARSPVYAKALQELNAYNDAMLKLAMDSGLIDKDAYDLMAGQPYVPFYRLMEEGDMKGPNFSSGLVNQKAWQKLKGGTQQLNADLLQNMLLNWSHLLQASAKNRAATATMDAAEKMAVAYKVDADTKGSVKVMRDGSAEHWMVEDPYLLDAISAIHYVPSPLMKPLAKFKQLLTWGVTVNPTFKIRNLIRDSVSAIAQSELGYNPGANVAKGWKLTAKDSQIYASMLASGGLIKFGTQENTDRLRAQVAKLGGVVLDKSGTERFFGQIKDLYDVYNEFGDRAENVNRAALYDALIKKGKTHAEAAFMARDLMDFSMSGSAPVVRFLTQAVPFLNARLVGLDKLGRAAIEDPRRFAAVSGAVALASLALLAAYSDDDDWKKREDWDRDAYWWFKIGGQAYRIPKPFEVGAIGTLAERTAELMLSDEMTGKRYMERVSHMLSGTFSFNPVPQAFKPLLDLYANKDSFTGRAIESQADQRLRPQDRYSERTPEVAKFLGGLGLPDPAQLVKGEYSALSPKQVEHLIRGYFSWVGTAAMTVSDFGLRPLAGRGERPDMRLKDVFIAGNFVENLPTGSSRYVTQMYEQARQAEQAYASYQEAIKAGDTDKAQSIKESAGPLLRNRPAYTAATRQLAEINRMAKRIEADQAMAGAAKRARLTQLEQQRHVIAQRVSRLAAATP